MQKLSSLFQKYVLIISLVLSVCTCGVSDVILTPKKLFVHLTSMANNMVSDLSPLIEQDPGMLQYKEYPRDNGKSIIVIDYFNYRMNGFLFNLSKKAKTAEDENEFYLRTLMTGSTIPIFRIEVDGSDEEDSFKDLVDVEHPFSTLGKDKIIAHLNMKIVWTEELKEEFLKRSDPVKFYSYKTKKTIPDLADFNMMIVKGKGVKPEIDENNPYDAEAVKSKFKTFLEQMTNQVQDFIFKAVEENINEMKTSVDSQNLTLTDEDNILFETLKNKLSNSNKESSGITASLENAAVVLTDKLATDQKLKEFTLRFNREFETEIRNIMVGKQLSFQGYTSRLRHRSNWIFKDDKYNSFCRDFSDAVNNMEVDETYNNVLIKFLRILIDENFYPFLDEDEIKNPWYAITKPLIDQIFSDTKTVIEEIEDKDSELKGIQEGIDSLNQEFLSKIAENPPALLVNGHEIESLVETFINEFVSGHGNGLLSQSKYEIINTLTSFSLKGSQSSENFQIVNGEESQFWNFVLDNERLLLI